MSMPKSTQGLRPTKRRLELLQAVAEARVYDAYEIGLGWRTEWDRGPGAKPRISRPADGIRQLGWHGWIALRPGKHWNDDRLWALTDTGRAVLEANGGKP